MRSPCLTLPAFYAVGSMGELQATAYISISAGSTTTKLHLAVIAEV